MEKNQPKKVLIVDPLLEPFRVKMEESQFVLFKKPEKGDDIILGYYTKFDLLLREVVRQKLLEDKDTQSLGLSEFIKEWRQMMGEFLEKIKLD